MKIQFLKTWRIFTEGVIVDTEKETIDAKTVESLIKFGYAKDTGGTIGQDSDNSTKSKNGK